MDVKEALGVAEFWMDVWQAEIDAALDEEESVVDVEERKAIVAFEALLAYVRKTMRDKQEDQPNMKGGA